MFSTVYHVLSPSQAPSYEDLKTVADRLAADARDLAMDEQYMSPFAVKAQHYGINFRGGKLDDITVLLASVVDCWPDEKT